MISLIPESEAGYMRLIISPTSPQTTRGFDTYWRFAAERQQIYLRRIMGCPVGHLTLDPVLATYRFTNPYRAADRVSQYLINHVQYDKRWNWRDTFVRTLIFKIFNRIDIWCYLSETVGEPDYDSLTDTRIERALGKVAGMRPIYSPAYIMPVPRQYTGPKYVRHLALIRDIVADGAHKRIQEASTMSQGFAILRSYDSIGSFLAYQYITDLNYSRHLLFSENEFTVPGPGALRGLKKCFITANEFSPSYLLKWTADRQNREFSSRELQWQGLWGRELKLIDIQNLFCEVDKYTRVALPDLGTGVAGTRIKQRYRPNNTPLTTWFPPKWRINERIECDRLLVAQPGQRRLFSSLPPSIG